MSTGPMAYGITVLPPFFCDNLIYSVYTITDIMSSVYRVTDMGGPYSNHYGKVIMVLLGGIAGDSGKGLEID